MNDIAMTALFLVALLKSAMSCLYGLLLKYGKEQYLASMGGGKLPGRDGDEYPASLRSFLAFRSFDLYASGSSFREGRVRPLAMSAQERLADEVGAGVVGPRGTPDGGPASIRCSGGPEAEFLPYEQVRWPAY